MYTVTVPPSQRDEAVKTLWRKLRVKAQGSDLTYHGIVIGRLIIADEATHWREFMRSRITSPQTIDFPDTESFETALAALRERDDKQDVSVTGNPARRQITVRPYGMPRKRSSRPRPRSRQRVETAEYLGIERDGVALEVEKKPGADCTWVSIARGDERYVIRFYMPFDAAVTHADQRDTSRRLIVSPTVDDKAVFTAEPLKDQRWAHDRLWLSNGRRWYDAMTGVGIAPYQPEDAAVAARLGKLNTYSPIPELIVSHFRLWEVK